MPVRTALRVLAGLVMAVCWLLAPAHARSQPLPDRDAFFREVRRQLRDDRRAMADYTRREIVQQHKLDGDGRVVERTVREFEVFPSAEEGLTYRRLVKVDSVPVPAAELEKQDGRYRRKAQQRIRELQRQGTNGKQHAADGDVEKRREEEQLLNELFRLFDLAIVGRDVYDGAPAIVVRFDPRPGVRGRTDFARWLQKMKGRAWIHETAYEVLHVEAEIIDTISWGWFVARLDAGSTAAFTRRRIADGTWLPVEAKFSASGRILLLKRFRQESITRFTDYAKRTDDSQTSFRLPVESRP